MRLLYEYILTLPSCYMKKKEKKRKKNPLLDVEREARAVARDATNKLCNILAITSNRVFGACNSQPSESENPTHSTRSHSVLTFVTSHTNGTLSPNTVVLSLNVTDRRNSCGFWGAWYPVPHCTLETSLLA